MISIKVTAHYGVPMAPPLSSEFDEMGGQIGRAVGNALVLPDPQRHVSRIHASIVFVAGKYVIRDLSTASPVYLNGRPLGNGHEAPIGDGDEITIAGYTMFVTKEPDRQPSLGMERAKVLGNAGQDPLLALGGASQTADPFADLISPPSPAPPSMRSSGVSKEDRDRPKSVDIPPAAPRPRESAVEPGGIPDDFDPFAEPAPKAAPTTPPVDNFGLGATGRETNIDALFDLPKTGDSDPFKPGHPLAAPDNEPNSSLDPNPLIPIGRPGATPRDYSSQRDDTPEIHGAFQLPKSRPNRGDDGNKGAGGDVTGSASNGHPMQPVNAGSLPQTGARSLPLSGYPSDTGQPPAHEELPGPVAGAPGAVSPARTGLEQSSAGPVAGNTPPAESTPDVLLREFLAGAGIPGASIPNGLTPELMRTIGFLLHESIQGTVELLKARRATKGLLRAQVTIMFEHDNNPLKLSPSGKAALKLLLIPQDRGYMSPEHAITDAYNSLRSHELGFVAGMQAALGGMLARFHPDQLEQRLTQKGMVDALLPMARRARLWDLFAELYSDISKEAEDDFHTLFGREFLRAYEAQIDELEPDEQRNKRR